MAAADLKILATFGTIDLKYALLAATLGADHGALGGTVPLTFSLIAEDAFHRSMFLPFKRRLQRKTALSSIGIASLEFEIPAGKFRVQALACLPAA
jgi:hypothetical protein